MAEALTGARADFIGCAAAVTLPGLFRRRCALTPDAVAYRQFDATAGVWRDFSWRSMAARVARFAEALARSGAEPGDRVALALPNCVDWVAFDMAALSLGLIVTPLYVQDSTANMGLILAHSDARLALLDTSERWAALVQQGTAFPNLGHVWLRKGRAAADAAATRPQAPRPQAPRPQAPRPQAPRPQAPRPHVSCLQDVLPKEGRELEPCELAAHAIDAEDVATLIYTSGSTGSPKGVMLSHRAILWNAEAVASVVPPHADDVFLSVLPLAHAYERTMGYYAPMMSGSTVAYCRSARELRKDLLTIRPTILLGVPRLYEHLRDAIQAAAARNPLKRRLLDLAAALGWRRFEASQGRGARPGPLEQVLAGLLDRLVARRIRRSLGGRLRVAVTSGAPAASRTMRFLIGLGLPLIEGYGLSEAAPALTATSIEDNLPGSVGRPLPGIDTRIGAEGELLARTPGVMKGYWKDPDRTARAIDSAGWLHTGDIAAIEDGRIFIRGRLDDVLALTCGEKVNAAAIEAEIKKDPCVIEVVVAGDGKPFPVAVIQIDGAAFSLRAAERGLDPRDLDHPGCKSLMLEDIERRLKDFPRHAQVRGVHLTQDAWSIESGLQTPTLKVKRRRVEQKYAVEIARLYGGL